MTIPDQTAIDALVATLRDRLRAQCVSSDADRAAVIACPVGPYTVAAGQTLIVNGATATLTLTGSQTAAAVAADIGAQLTGVVASADTDGRLVLTRSATPADDAPSQLVLGLGTANAALGLVPSVSDVQRLSISAPSPIVLPHAIERARPVDRPVIAVERTDEPAAAPLKGEVWAVNVSLTMVFPAAVGNAESALEALRAFSGAVRATIHSGDTRGRNKIGGYEFGGSVVDCIMRRSTKPATLLAGEQNSGRRYAVAQDEWTVRVYSTEV